MVAELCFAAFPSEVDSKCPLAPACALGAAGAGVEGSSAACGWAALQICAVLYVLSHVSTGVLMYNHRSVGNSVNVYWLCLYSVCLCQFSSIIEHA